MNNAEEPAPDVVPVQEPVKHQKPSVVKPREAQSDKEFGLPEDTNGSQFISLMKLHPFMSLFIFAAKTRYPMKRSDRSRVEEFIKGHGKFYKACWVADFTVTAILTAMLLATVGLGAWKTLFGSF